LSRLDRLSIINWEKLNHVDFDSATYSQVREAIINLGKMYSNRRSKALDIKEAWMNNNIISQKKEGEFFALQDKYTNEKIIVMVKNSMSMKSIVEVGDKLIRKATPIYATPDIPSNPLNFRTFYYAPEKYFAGRYYDTFWFNVIIIWVMFLFGLIALYFDLLKKIIQLFEKIGDINFKRKLKKAQPAIRK
jgi:hypothetical protein